jgi:hypothetical protein
MSLQLTNVQQTEFDTLVKITYQSMGFKLRDTIRVRTDIIGASCQFRKMGQVIANPTAYQATVPIQDPGFTALTANLTKFTAATAVDEIQDLAVNFDTKRELSQTVAMAIGRRSDQITINALVAGGAGQVIAAAGTNMTYSKLRQIVQVFEENAVPIEERFIAISGSNLRSLLADDHLISRFYTSNDAVAKGTLNYAEMMSVNVRIIPNMPEGGLPLAGTIRTALAWHKMSSGFAIGQDMRTEVNYLPRETSWLVNGIFFAGAIAVDTLGIQQVLCDESVNP